MYPYKEKAHILFTFCNFNFFVSLFSFSSHLSPTHLHPLYIAFPPQSRPPNLNVKEAFAHQMLKV